MDTEPVTPEALLFCKACGKVLCRVTTGGGLIYVRGGVTIKAERLTMVRCRCGWEIRYNGGKQPTCPTEADVPTPQ